MNSQSEHCNLCIELNVAIISRPWTGLFGYKISGSTSEYKKDKLSINCVVYNVIEHKPDWMLSLEGLRVLPDKEKINV